MGHKVALFGGSFNPPHIGHYLVISYLLAAEDIDEVWVVPTYKHAEGKKLIEFFHRFVMCTVMCRDFRKDRVRARNAEETLCTFLQFPDSRTINLVRYMTTEYPNYEFRLVIGSDLVESAKKWNDWEEIEKLAPPLIVGRIGYGSERRFMLPNVSSTEIRNSIDNGSLETLVPRSVAEYIKQHNLYKSEIRI